jgi:tetratricopeptide (TPR) repeat protein
MRLAKNLSELSQDAPARAAAREALDEARSLMRPDWPAEFRILLLRWDAAIARDAGRRDEALALFRDEVRATVASGDWRLEAMSRGNLVDLLWEIGPIEEAARESRQLIDAFRTRPAADSDMDTVFINLIGILSELGRVDDALAVAHEALPLLRRTRRYYVEEWVHLFWRAGQLEPAALLLGASDAQQLRAGTSLQPNERRLIAEARAALAAELSPQALASALAAGAALDDAQIDALITEALARAGGGQPRRGS